MLNVELLQNKNARKRKQFLNFGWNNRGDEREKAESDTIVRVFAGAI